VTDPLPPIVIVGDGDFAVNATLSAASISVEAVDVNNRLYEAFDSTGRQLQFRTHGDSVRLELRSDSETNLAELERRLREHITQTGGVRGVLRPADVPAAVMLHALLRREAFMRGTQRWWLRRGSNEVLPAGLGGQHARKLRADISTEVAERVVAELEASIGHGNFHATIAIYETVALIHIDPDASHTGTLTVGVFFDGSFELFVDDVYESDQSDPVGDIEASSRAICAAVAALARIGLVTARRWRFLGPLSPAETGPPDDPRIMDLVGRDGWSVVLRRQPWAN
jgi:hypothetical protein